MFSTDLPLGRCVPATRRGHRDGGHWGHGIGLDGACLPMWKQRVLEIGPAVPWGLQAWGSWQLPSTLAGY